MSLHQLCGMQEKPQETEPSKTAITKADSSAQDLWKTDSALGNSGAKARAFSNLGPHAAKLPPLNKSRQQSVADSEDMLDRSIQV